jgi:hypothetical protein
MIDDWDDESYGGVEMDGSKASAVTGGEAKPIGS